MADPQVVSCPGCGKRYSVPAGSPPGQFQCQDCSAVVVYGRGEPPPAAQGRGKARTHAKAAAAKRKLARNRREEEDEEDDRPAHGRRDSKKPDATIYLVGIVGALVVVVALVFMLKKPEAKPEPSKESAAVPARTSPSSFDAPPEEAPAPAPKPAPRPAPRPETVPEPGAEAPKPAGGMQTAVRGGVEDKADTFTPAANPPSGGNYGKSQAALILLLKDNRPEVWSDPGHLPDTPPDVAQKIDGDVLKMADVNGGSEGFKAQDRLIKIGRPAIPKVLGLVSKLDFSKYSSVLEARDACILGDAIDHVLREITGYDKIRQLQYSPQNGKITEYMESLDAWCLWWYTIGYKRETFYKAAGAPEDEKL